MFHCRFKSMMLMNNKKQSNRRCVCSPVWKRARRSPPRSRSLATAPPALSSRCSEQVGWSWRRSEETPSSQSRTAPSPLPHSDAPWSPGRPGLRTERKEDKFSSLPASDVNCSLLPVWALRNNDSWSLFPPAASEFIDFHIFQTVGSVLLWWG